MSLLLLFRPSVDVVQPDPVVTAQRASARERSRGTAQEHTRATGREHTRATAKD